MNQLRLELHDLASVQEQEVVLWVQRKREIQLEFPLTQQMIRSLSQDNESIHDQFLIKNMYSNCC